MEISKFSTTIFFLIVSLVLVFLFVIPKYQQTLSLQTDLDKQQAQYNNQSNYYEKLSRLLSDIESRPDALKKIENALPNNPFLAPIVSFLQKKAKENELIVESIVFSQAHQSAYGQAVAIKSNKEVKNITFTVLLSGTYKSLKNFLASLDKSARLFEINTISFSLPESLQES